MKDTHHTAFLLKALDWLLGRILKVKRDPNPNHDLNTVRLSEKRPKLDIVKRKTLSTTPITTMGVPTKFCLVLSR